MSVLPPDNDSAAADTVDEAPHPVRALLAVHPDASHATFTPRVGPPQDVVSVSVEGYHDLVAGLRGIGFDGFVDLCGVDYLRRRPRFEVVVILLSHPMRRRVRVRVGVPADAPHLATISDIYPGANFYERETYDMFGIVFDGHPDLTRILMPDDWKGHPLRKDYAVGSVPVQFKAAHRAT
ncbi:MAG: NADH-quinone oxidoreductase subunit C [Actinomycetota bacterium]|nr:NADH-quinone oxidoreductase subunit C [Actinomycetota bacterium]